MHLSSTIGSGSMRGLFWDPADMCQVPLCCCVTFKILFLQTVDYWFSKLPGSTMIGAKTVMNWHGQLMEGRLAQLE